MNRILPSISRTGTCSYTFLADDPEVVCHCILLCVNGVIVGSPQKHESLFLHFDFPLNRNRERIFREVKFALKYYNRSSSSHTRHGDKLVCACVGNTEDRRCS
ncbi:hypothetical protein L798_13666 [Zootermopsis nevadensis]|uniref:Uncharacterized protein n=1 Tax=Zootermopsis nevadensis TaxID=136037 RepID=A0A067R0T0_ZOONE|nr:hypothetical protein L798_13666 [Zootermopsis nevadensis]